MRQTRPPPTAATIISLAAAMMLMAGTVLAQEEDGPTRRSTKKSGENSGKDAANGTRAGSGKRAPARLVYVGKKKPSSPSATAKDKISDDCEVGGGLTPGMICIGEKIARGGGAGGGGAGGVDASEEAEPRTARLDVTVRPDLFSADSGVTYKLTLKVGKSKIDVPRDLELRIQVLSDIATVMGRLRKWERPLTKKEARELKRRRSFTHSLVTPFKGLKKMRLVAPVNLTVRIPNLNFADITSH